MPEEIKHYLIGIAIFTMFIVGGISLISLFRADNHSMIPSSEFVEFNNTFNTFDDLNSEVTNLQSELEGTDTSEWGVFGVLNGLINSAWQTFKTTVSSLYFMTTAMMGASKMFGIPSWFITIISLIVVIVIVYSILGAIFQR